MKKISKTFLTLLPAAVLAFSVTACAQMLNSPDQTAASMTDQTVASTTDQTAASTTDQTQTTELAETGEAGLWGNATFLEDTEIGQGSKTLVVEVKVENQSVKLTVHTDETTVGAALLANNLLAGEEGPYGLYVKEVNGITADYDIDQSYWAFYIDGEYALTGVDGTEIAEGSVYKLEYTK